MKMVATSMFLLAAVVFVISAVLRDNHAAWGYVKAASEAAMVGALADWFAVTALFKHPLGLPIPHTAIIQKRKEQIGASLGGFVKDNFLTHRVISARLESANIAAHLGSWLSNPANATEVGKQGAVAISGISEVLEDKTVQAGFTDVVTSRIDAIDTAPVAARVLEIAVSGGHHQALFDGVLVGLSNFLDDNSTLFRAKFNEESPWWVPGLVDDKVFDKIHGAVKNFIDEIAQDADHSLRLDFDSRAKSLITELRESPEMAARAEELKGQLLSHPEVRAWIDSLWSRTKEAVLHASHDPDSELRQKLKEALVGVGSRLESDQELQTKVDRWIVVAVSYIANEFREEVSGLIETTVNNWDAKETAERLELQVGRDLQFIRINGTIVGGLAGLVIYTLSELFL